MSDKVVALETASILVVDDNAQNRDLLSHHLQRKSYGVTEADSGPQALELIDNQKFDMVLLDIMMPGMDGLDALKMIRKNHTAAALPIIMVTAKHDSSEVVECLSAGANDYVTKPIDYPVLFARIETQLERKLAQDGLFELTRNLKRRIEEHTTELQHANKALRSGEERYRSLYHQIPVIIYILDTDATISSINRFGAEQLGYEVDGLVGQPVSTLYPAGDMAVQRLRMETCFQQPEIVHRWDVQKVRKDGRKLQGRLTVRVVENADGVQQLLIVCEEINKSAPVPQDLSNPKLAMS